MKPVRVELAHRANYGVRRGKIEWIVMHYTANDGDSGMSNSRYFQKALNPVASAHYFVDDREIVQSVPDEYVAYHCGAYKYRHPFCRNYNSIGIEMCDSKRDGKVMATEQTIRNAAELAAALCERYGLPVSHIIRHYDVTGKLCPAYWSGRENAGKWEKEFHGKLTAPDYRAQLQKRAGLTDGTMDYLSAYQYGDDLIRKLATMK